MAKLRSSNIEPSTATTLALGASGDAALISSDSIKANTFQDLGGNSLWVSDGAGTLSSVNTSLAGGGFTLISTQTADGSASLAFTSGLDSTYDEYMFVFTDINPATDSTYFTFQCNAVGQTGYDEVITSTAFGAYHYENDSSAALGYAANEDQAQGTAYQKLAYEVGNGADESCAGILHVFTPSNTTYVKHWYSRVNNYSAGDRTIDTFMGGYINTVTAIDDIQFKMASGNFDGVIQMYGVS